MVIRNTNKLVSSENTNAELYGGTLCATQGFRTECVQYVIPTENMKEMDRKTFDPEKVKVTIWYGARKKNMKNKQTEQPIEKYNTGYEYYSQVFLSTLISNEKKFTKNSKKCVNKNDLQSPEPPQDPDKCAKEFKSVNLCNTIVEHTNKKTIENRVDNDAMCDSVKAQFRSLFYDYSQRMVDGNCCDLINKHTDCAMENGQQSESESDLDTSVNGQQSDLDNVP